MKGIPLSEKRQNQSRPKEIPIYTDKDIQGFYIHIFLDIFYPINIICGYYFKLFNIYSIFYDFVVICLKNIFKFINFCGNIMNI